jgi:glyoxylase-like metal-dependent hydrolase (beta-lactamase superfamily II)
MTKRTRWLAPALVLIAACAPKSPEQQIVADAAAALGGRDRVLAAKTLVIDGEGTNGNLGQDMTMEAAGQQFAVTGYKRRVDLANMRARVEQTRTPNFAYFQGPAPQRQVFGVDGDVAYAVPASGPAVRGSNLVARDRIAEIYHHPLAIVRAGLDPSSKLANARTAGNERVVDVTTPRGVFTLAIDASSARPTRVVSMTDNVNLGDVAVETKFADYDDVSGLQLPRTLTTTLDKYQISTLHVTNQVVNIDVGDLAAPEPARSAPPVAGPPPANVTVEQIAKGVWFLAGQSHHSVLVEFADHLTLIEAPQNDTRTLAVIAKARELRPAKPLTEVVNTHHHFDHSGGVRAAVSEGLSVVTQKGNAAFFEDAARRPHTIGPDALAANPKPIKVVTVDDELTLKDSTMTVQLFHVAGNPHADTMLMAYLPRERVLVEVDAYSPGAPVQPYAANLVENIRRRNLRVDRIVPLHGAMVPFSELMKTQQKS